MSFVLFKMKKFYKYGQYENWRSIDLLSWKNRKFRNKTSRSCAIHSSYMSCIFYDFYLFYTVSSSFDANFRNMARNPLDKYRIMVLILYNFQLRVMCIHRARFSSRDYQTNKPIKSKYKSRLSSSYSMPQMQRAKTSKSSSLLSLQSLCPKNGPSLSLDNDLCGFKQSSLLRPIPLKPDSWLYFPLNIWLLQVPDSSQD